MMYVTRSSNFIIIFIPDYPSKGANVIGLSVVFYMLRSISILLLSPSKSVYCENLNENLRKEMSLSWLSSF